MKTWLKAIWLLAVMAAIASLVALGHSPGIPTETASTTTTPDYFSRHDRDRAALEYGVRENGQTRIYSTQLAY